MYIVKSIDDVKVGDKTYYSKTLTDADVVLYAGIIGDNAPLHLDEEFAKKTRYGRRISYGMLTIGFVSTAVGRLGGHAGLYLSQEMRFTAPVFIGDTLFAEVEAVEVDQVKHTVTIKTTVRNQDGKTVLDGQGRLLLLPEVVLESETADAVVAGTRSA